MRTFLLLCAAAAVIVFMVYALAGCALVMEGNCSSTRETEITRTNGQPDTTRTTSARTCGDHPPALPAAKPATR